MKVTISKILNKTDLAQSGSHGGLVVTKADQQALRDFFEIPGKDQPFTDKSDQEIFNIHYQDYTSNGTTPNDRITPIGKYATKHNLQPGDTLMLERVEKDGKNDYFIEYARRLGMVIFAGKYKTTVDILNFEQLIDVLSQNIPDGTVKRLSGNEFEMKVHYLGITGTLRILQNADDYELYFNDTPISENKKYFELDASVNPFVLKKTETWRVTIDMDEEVVDANKEADAELISGLAESDLSKCTVDYNPIPEEKSPAKESKGRKVPARDRQKAENSTFLHPLFLSFPSLSTN